MAAFKKSGDASKAGRRMEGGLLHTDLVEWPTVKVYQECHRLFKTTAIRQSGNPDIKVLSLFQMIDIWRSVCKVAEDQLCKGRGIKLEGFGTLTLDAKLSPAFFPEMFFEKTHGLPCNTRPMKGSTINQSLPYCSVDKATKGGALRDNVEKVMAAMASGVRWALDFDVPSLMLQLGGIGDFVVGEGPDGKRQVGVRFSGEFLAMLKVAQSKRPPPSLGLLYDRREKKAEAENRRTEANSASWGGFGGSGGQAAAGVATFKKGVNAVLALRAMGGMEDTDKAIRFLRKRLFERHGMYAIRDARRLLRVMDETGDGEVNRKELVHGFRGMGIVVSLKVVEKLFLAMDRDGSGTLSIEELYLGMRGAMNLTRVKLINKLHEDLVKRSAPNSMPERDDSVPVGFLVEEWNGDHFDDVKSRRRRFEDVRDLYFAQLDGDLVAPKNGFITRTKMLDFYQDLTEAFVGDGSGGDPEGNDQFAFFVRATWNFWDMRGFEAPRKESSRGALHKGRDDSNADDNDDDFGAGADGFDLPGRQQQQQQQRPQTAESEASDASGSGRRRPGGSSKQVAGRRRDPVPWEANHSWSHADMRSSLSAQPHVPMPRVGSAAAAALGMSSAAAEAAANSGLTVSDLDGLPAAVFGDLSSLVHGNGRARDSSAAAKLILPKHDCWDEMRRLFFEPPPGAFQDFCERLKLSKVDESPPIASSSLASRVFELGKKRALAAQKAGHGGGKQHRFAQRDADAIASAVFREAQRSNWPTNRRDSGGNGDDNASEAESEFSAGSSSWAGSSVASGARGGRGQQNFPVAAEKEGALVPARWLFDRLVTLYGASAAEKKRRQVSVLDRVRNMLVDQCGPLGLGELRKQLTLMDLDGSLTLDEDELKKGFGLMGLYLNNREVEQVFWEFDRDKDGTVDYDEFMDGIRGGPMSHDRRKLVKQAWRHVTRGGGGSAVLDVDVLMQAFNCLWYPSVASRAADPARVVEAVHKRFCDGDNGGGNQQTVDFHAFLQYHWDVSASVEGDRVFDAVVRNTWQFSS